MNFILLVLVAVAIGGIQCLTGGTRLAFSLPAFGVIALAALLSLPGIRKRGNPAWLSCLVVTVVVFGYLAVRAALSPVDYLWWSDFYTLIAGLTIYLIVALYLTGANERSALVMVLLALALVACLVGVRQFMKADNFMMFGFIRQGIGRRASGFFVGPNVFAGFLEVVGIMSLSLVCWSRWPGWVRFVIGYGCAVCYFGLAITGSRGGYLSSFASLIVFGLLSLWAVRRIAPHRLSGTVLVGSIILGGILLAASALMSSSFLVEQRFGVLQKVMSKEMSDVRVSNWAAAIDQYHLSLVNGTGAGTHLFYARKFRRDEIQSDPIHAHCDYLEILAEYGILGLAGVGLFLIVHAWAGLRSISDLATKEAENMGLYRTNALALQIGSLSALAAMVVHAGLDFNLHIPGNALVYAIILGMLAGSNAREPEGAPAGWGTFAFRIALPGLGLWMFATGVPKLPGEILAEKARVALERRGDYKEAIELGHQALAYQRRNPEIYLRIGEANRRLAEGLRVPILQKPFFQAAVAAYEAGLKIFPEDENLWLRLGQALDGLKDYQRASDAFQKAFELDPKLWAVHALYANHLKLCGRLSEAERELTIARELGKSDFAKAMESVSASPRQNGIQPKQ